MRLLHVITGMQKAAGTSVFCGEICNRLVAVGHEVAIAVVDKNAADCYCIDHRIKLISIAKLFSDLRILKPTGFDIVHIHAIWSPILHSVSNWAHASKIPVVWSPHGMLTPWAMRHKWWKKFPAWWLYQKRDLHRAALLHATAESEVGDIRRMGLKNKVVVAPLGTNINNRAEHAECVGGKGTLLFVSRVQRKKGLLNLARAWAMLPKELRAGWCVRIVGPDQEGHTAEVSAECERLNVAGDWTFVGPKYGEDLRREYAGADLFVLPTHSENFGSVVIEALAHGVPVITTKGAPWKELVERQCGWWVDVGVDPLVVALKHAMSYDDAQLREMGARGRELVEEKYNWNAVVKAMVKGYAAILKEK